MFLDDGRPNLRRGKQRKVRSQLISRVRVRGGASVIRVRWWIDDDSDSVATGVFKRGYTIGAARKRRFGSALPSWPNDPNYVGLVPPAGTSHRAHGRRYGTPGLED